MRFLSSYIIRVFFIIVVLSGTSAPAAAAPNWIDEGVRVRDRIIRVVKAVQKIFVPTTNTDTIVPPKP